MDIVPYDPRTATDAEAVAHHDLVSAIDVEAAPDDEPQTLADFTAYVTIGPPARTVRFWACWEDAPHTRMLGVSMLLFWDEPTNRDMASFWVDVRPEARRQGIGRRLLAPLLDAAEAAGRTKLDVATSSRCPAGIAFAEALGGRHAFTGRRNALDTDTLDVALLNEWVDRAKERAADYHLDAWDAPCPEDKADAYIEAMHVMNTAPREDFDVEDEVFTVELLRQHEATNAARNADQWIVAAVHTPTGHIAGYTEIVLPGHWPTRVYQGDTGVDPAHRDQGLGRWLKATMLLRLLDERPDVTRIVTFNAGSNEPMLNINHALGFRCIDERPTYQLDLADMRRRL